MFKENFKGISTKFQGCFNKDEGRFEKVFDWFQGYLKEVQREFQKSFRGVFKGVLSKLEE